MGSCCRHPVFTAAIKLPEGDTRNDALSKALLRLPAKNYRLLDALVRHLRRVGAEQQTNRMSHENLALVFGPTIARSPRGIEGDLRDNGAHIMIAKALINLAPAIWSSNANVKRSSVRPRASTKEAKELQVSSMRRDRSRRPSAMAESRRGSRDQPPGVLHTPAPGYHGSSPLAISSESPPAPKPPAQMSSSAGQPVVNPVGMQLPSHLLAKLSMREHSHSVRQKQPVRRKPAMREEGGADSRDSLFCCVHPTPGGRSARSSRKAIQARPASGEQKGRGRQQSKHNRAVSCHICGAFYSLQASPESTDEPYANVAGEEAPDQIEEEDPYGAPERLPPLEDPYQNINSSDSAAGDDDEEDEDEEDEGEEGKGVGRFANLRHSLRKASPQARVARDRAVKAAVAKTHAGNSKALQGEDAQPNAAVETSDWETVLADEPWYVASITRNAMVDLKAREVSGAQRLLKPAGPGYRRKNVTTARGWLRCSLQAGAFIVYPSRSDPGNFCLSVWTGEKLWTGLIVAW